MKTPSEISSRAPFALTGPTRAMLVLPLLLAACSDLPRPTYMPQDTAALVPVGYPPPPARVEFIPSQPRGAAVWLDGEWTWSGSKWAWTQGRWVIPPATGRFLAVDDRAGRARDRKSTFASGVWKDRGGPPAPLVQRRSRSGARPPATSRRPRGRSGEDGADRSPVTARDVPAAEAARLPCRIRVHARETRLRRTGIGSRDEST